MHVIIVGCGRFGTSLAEELIATPGTTVVLVDEDRSAFAGLETDLPATMVVGTGFDLDVLKEAGIEKADAVLALTNRHTANIMIARIAGELFHVPRVIARIDEPKEEEVYRSLGLHVVCPSRLAIQPTKDDLLS